MGGWREKKDGNEESAEERWRNEKQSGRGRLGEIRHQTYVEQCVELDSGECLEESKEACTNKSSELEMQEQKHEEKKKKKDANEKEMRKKR